MKYIKEYNEYLSIFLQPLIMKMKIVIGIAK